MTAKPAGLTGNHSRPPGGPGTEVATRRFVTGKDSHNLTLSYKEIAESAVQSNGSVSLRGRPNSSPILNACTPLPEGYTA